MRVICDNVVADNLAEKYVLGGLSCAEQEAYELHFFQCERCFGELRGLQAVQAALQQTPPAAPLRNTGRKQWARWGWSIAGAVAASLVGVVLLRPFNTSERAANGERPPAIPASPGTSIAPRMAASEAPPSASYAEDATVTAPAQMGVTSERTELLGRLARVEPPRYSPSVLRGFPDDAMSAFQQGMKSYVVGNYGAAVPPLRIAANLDPTRPDFAFFLAATELLSGDVAAAATEFTRTIEMGDTPFREEAHFYLAKAHLKQRDVDGARRELMMVTGMQGALRHDADVLLKQLESVDSNE